MRLTVDSVVSITSPETATPASDTVAYAYSQHRTVSAEFIQSNPNRFCDVASCARSTVRILANTTRRRPSPVRPSVRSSVRASLRRSSANFICYAQSMRFLGVRRWLARTDEWEPAMDVGAGTVMAGESDGRWRRQRRRRRESLGTGFLSAGNSGAGGRQRGRHDRYSYSAFSQCSVLAVN